MLTTPQLSRLDEAYYRGEDMYRSAAYNRRGLFDWEARIVESHVRPRSRIAVLGAGGGREVLALLALGHDAWGFEPYHALAAVGSDLTAADGYGRRVAVMARDGWACERDSFDAVVFGWGAYMLLPSRQDRVERLREAAAATGRPGVIVTSFFTMPLDRRQLHVTFRVARRLRQLLGRPAPLLGDALVPNFAHHFTRSQIVEELVEAELELVEWGTAPGGYGWAVARRAGAAEGAAGE
ncbi:hypothetical protein DQ244_00715 [Blastococcus sp. TBT05-19]|uniref:hypothetical protein n=1 Tax=Blastococcus sp. TBT05-19 TaxID=2250581 RepID=UPI000DEB60A6|nr:hypothetical protein [Blastococcus sp. TBT05-19]RBY93931.1 hypothetical protein DQ244_00715 [Blastococcus sp. TBT05-19]